MLASGDQLGPYEILAPLGAGGMGEVYKARDTRLDRTVAIKVLPEHIAKREDLRARFEREARAVASLNHPHICSLFDVGPGYMVMELIEGESLAARIEKGAIPLDQALQFAGQIADALERAHRAGVTHRDVKPQNIMLTRDGVKVLDFGLAKSQAKPGPTEETLTKVLTTEGTIMGTPQYMAPEQFAGKEADARSDIWAFGAVLYEMVTGRKAFHGSNYQSLVGAILATDPAPMAVQPFTPSWLERLVRRCLAKDPEDRWQTMRDVVIELKSPPAEAVPVAATSNRWPWAVAGAAMLALAAVSLIHFRETPPEQPVLTMSILPPEKADFNQTVISPDGKLLAFTATAGGKQQLWLRPLHSLTAQPLAGTEEAYYPFWSPDSRWIGFFAQGKVKKIGATGGPAQTLCDADRGRSGTWNQDGVIVYGSGGGLWRVSAQGGNPAQLPAPDQAAHRWPVFLPGGQRYLYMADGNEKTWGIYLGALDSKERTKLVVDRSSPGYAEGPDGKGYLLFVRETALMAQQFDAATGALAGESFPVAEKVAVDPTGRAAFSVSGNGMLVYGSVTRGRGRLTWMDRGGQRLETLGDPSAFFNLALSPDGKRVALQIPAAQGQGADIWVRDLARDLPTRLTFDPSYNAIPVWSPDGSRIVFASGRKGLFDLYLKSASGAGQAERLLKAEHSRIPTDWTATGDMLLYFDQNPKTKNDLMVLPMTGERKPAVFLKTEFNEEHGAFSPDGKWIAYASDESGRYEIYVQPYPVTGAKWQLSRDGGRIAKWRRDGRELYWLQPDGTMMAAEVSVGRTFQPGKVAALFAMGIMSSNDRYGVTADGKRFLVAARDETDNPQPVTVVWNWLAGARR
jgi:serine/threonine protein kinase